MSKTVSINPVTRIEGHLGVKVEVESNRVAKAFVSGEMFRGFEVILRGRDPLDAQHITQRICGVCPIDHGVAAVQAQERAYQLTPAKNGQIARNLIQGANFIMSHISHFYLLSSLDFVDVAMITRYQGQDRQLLDLQAWVKAQLSSQTIAPAAPFLPRYTAKYLQDLEANVGALKHYLEALEIRALAHKMGAVFAGKMPHAATLVPGGITDRVTSLKIAHYRSLLEKIRAFVDQAYLPDVLAVARAFPEYFSLGQGCGNFLAYGAFPEAAAGTTHLLPPGVLLNDQLQGLDLEAITEDVTQSYFAASTARKPSAGETLPSPDKAGAYSWLKAPRYQNHVMEVGPLARLLIGYQQGSNAALKSAVDTALKALEREPKDLVSVMGRHLARALECKLVVERCAQWLDQLMPDAPAYADFTIVDTGRGNGLTEAPRGALGHWIEIRGQKIAHYQCVVPTTWNCSPRDARGTPGALEQALVGTPVADAAHPIEAARVIRSFDPCLACAVH